MTAVPFIRLSVFFSILIACSGCTTDPLNVETDFGESVRTMQDSQTYNSIPLKHHTENAVLQLDGNVADTNVESYRKPHP